MGHGQRQSGVGNVGHWVALCLWWSAQAGALWPSASASVFVHGASTHPTPHHTASPPSAAQWEGVVVKVVDGDTLHVQSTQGGAPHKLRIKGIDAPEICQPWGGQSREALARLVWGQRITVHMRDVDDHGRWLVHLSAQGQDVGALLVAQGHAWSYQFRRDPGPYAALEQQAASQRLGLFSQPQAMRPREFRHRHGPCH